MHNPPAKAGIVVEVSPSGFGEGAYRERRKKGERKNGKRNKERKEKKGEKKRRETSARQGREGERLSSNE